MEIKHTPGPWMFHEQGDANQYCLLTNDKRWVIAFSQNGELHTPEQIANAKLIAAAPELLEALILAIDALDPEKEHLDYDDSAFLEIKKAIKKATE